AKAPEDRFASGEELAAALESALAGEAPPPRSSAPSPLVERTNVVPDPTSFVGREGLLREIAERFARGERRVPLRGPGGVGKTRLAREHALGAAPQLRGGAWFVDLAEARTPAEIARSVAAVLDVPLLSAADPAELVGRALAARPA